MLRRILFAGMALVALGAPSALAGSVHHMFWMFKNQCEQIPAQVRQCALQVTNGDRNKAVTKQETHVYGGYSSTQLSFTYQDGDDNQAYTEQVGKNQFAKTIQIGNENSAFTYQEGTNQQSKTIQIGDGHWGVTSSIGEDTSTSVVQHN